MAVNQFGEIEFGAAEFGESVLDALSTPTILVTANVTESRIEIVVTNPGAAPDYNEIWRFLSGEPPIRLTASLPVGGTYLDYAVASGISYFYFARAVQVGGSFADSSVANTSVTFPEFRLHAVTKAAQANLSGTAYTFKAVPPQGRFLGRNQQMLFSPALVKPIAAPGEIVQRGWNVQVWSPNLSLTDVRSLQSLADLNQVLCVRDGRGRLMFGTISELPITYGVTTVINLALSESDYHLHVA
jgi:hypothetical protein